MTATSRSTLTAEEHPSDMAHAASGLADIYEACMQMRGECGRASGKETA